MFIIKEWVDNMKCKYCDKELHDYEFIGAKGYPNDFCGEVCFYYWILERKT